MVTPSPYRPGAHPSTLGDTLRDLIERLQRSRMLRPSIFGAFDGMTVVLGVLFTLTGHPELVFPTAVGVAVAEGVGMAAGEWLSNSDSGPAVAAVMGAAVLAGGVLPALPWLVLTGGWAIVCSILILIAQGAGIAVLRNDRGTSLALIETYGVLAVTIAVVWLVEFLTPGGAH